jgi:hypothetical protein
MRRFKTRKFTWGRSAIIAKMSMKTRRIVDVIVDGTKWERPAPRVIPKTNMAPIGGDKTFIFTLPANNAPVGRDVILNFTV